MLFDAEGETEILGVTEPSDEIQGVSVIAETDDTDGLGDIVAGGGLTGFSLLQALDGITASKHGAEGRRKYQLESNRTGEQRVGLQ